MTLSLEAEIRYSIATAKASEATKKMKNLLVQKGHDLQNLLLSKQNIKMQMDIYKR